MKKITKMFVFLMALFACVLTSKATITGTDMACNTDDTIGVGGMSCSLKAIISSATVSIDTRTKIEPNDTFKIRITNLRHVKDNQVTLSKTGFQFNGQDTLVLTFTSESEEKEVTVKYVGTTTLSAGEHIFAFGTYIKDDVNVPEAECGFDYSILPENTVCKKLVKNGTTYYYGEDGLLITQGKDGRTVEEEWNYQCAPACVIKEGKYYDYDGNEITGEDKEGKYYKSCFSCLKPGENDKSGKKVSEYHGLDGKPITAANPEEEYKKQCETTEPPKCEIKDNKYYDEDGKEVSKEVYAQKCMCRMEETKDGNKYYDDNNKEITEEEYNKVCKPVCRVEKNGEETKYYGFEGKEISYDDYKKICMCRIEEGKDGQKVYYNDKNEEITADQYKEQCEKPVPTGDSVPYVMILGGLLSAASIFFIIKSKNKLRKI